MADEKENGGKKRQRSPNYPAVSLRDAVERVRALYTQDGRPGAPLETAVRHFGFTSAHGQAMTIVSALKKFGLIEDKNGRIVPTPLAINVIEFKPDHQRHKEALREAALKPDIYGGLVERYREHSRLPSDESLRPELVTDMGFNPKAVSDFLVDFRDSLEYAGLLEGNTLKLPEIEQKPEPESESKPDARPWRHSGFPKNPEAQPAVSKPQQVEERPSDSNRTTEVSGATRPKRTPMQAGMKEDVFTLNEGPIVLQYPDRLSQESFEDFESWLQLIIRKAKRSIRTNESENSAENQ